MLAQTVGAHETHTTPSQPPQPGVEGSCTLISISVNVRLTLQSYSILSFSPFKCYPHPIPRLGYRMQLQMLPISVYLILCIGKNSQQTSQLQFMGVACITCQSQISFSVWRDVIPYPATQQMLQPLKSLDRKVRSIKTYHKPQIRDYISKHDIIKFFVIVTLKKEKKCYSY